MRDAIDKTSTQSGTLINRSFLMGIQGFDNLTTVLNPGRSITQTNANGEVKTISFNEGMIVKFVGEKTITKKITIENENMTVKEVLI